MICPHCGENTNPESARCEYCGVPLAPEDGARSGAHWGARSSSGSYARYTNSSDPAHVSNYVAATPQLRKGKSRGLQIAAGFCAIALVAGMALWGFATAMNNRPAAGASASRAVAEDARLHDVLIAVSGPGFDEQSTPLPVHITGGDAAGNAYDQVAFVTSDGSGLRLPAGNYGIEPAASPISANGGLYRYAGSKKWFSVDTELSRGERLDLREEVSLTLEVADPSDFSEDAMTQIRDYAIEAGVPAERVDELLAAAKAAFAQSQASTGFDLVQTYRDTTFVGDVRTSLSYAPAALIEGVQATPVRSDMFLFTSNTLLYAGNSYGSGNTAIALHSRNLTTGQESILATDLCSQTRPYYVKGQVVYQALNYSQSVQRIDVKSGEVIPVSEALPWNVSKLVGVTDNAALVATSDGQLPEVYTVPLDGSEPTSVTLGEEYGNVIGVYDGKILVDTSDWSTGKLAAFQLDGTKEWEAEVPSGTTFDYRLSVIEGTIATVNTGTEQVVSIDLETGAVKTFDTGIPYLYGVMFQRDGHIYFAGSDTYEYYSDTVTYNAYDLDTGSSSVNNLGSYEAPQDEELQAQQQAMTWNDSWGSTWSDTTGTTQDWSADTTQWDATATDTTQGWTDTTTDWTDTTTAYTQDWTADTTQWNADTTG